ncbi:MFS transporter [Streptomyces sp. DSM 41527]|uniref:MFS transporter n=1 Tax=Streptomyces mooreae TaxID=3075523 RepID=A0ABU2T8W5_9ACTN|nr:MFS transporter [Streptomyces sp. DSM 41527]MDT0457372.1 MFS transporter [Streptomyces sp. DSM 41527]
MTVPENNAAVCEVEERSGARRALVSVALGVFCIQLDSFALNPALSHIKAELGVSSGQLQWAVSAYLLSCGTLMLGAGRMSDLFGRRRVLTAGLALFGLASLWCSLAPSLPVLVAARVVQGAGGALIMPAGLALLTNVFPPALRGRATGWALGIGGLATACGPFVGGVLTEMVSWRAVFWLNVPLGVVAALCARRARESRDTTASGHVDWPGLATGTGAIAALAVCIDRGPVWGWVSPAGVGTLCLTALASAAFVRIELRAAEPLIAPALFRNGSFVALTAAGAVANAATVVFLFVVPLSLQEGRQLTPLAAGLAFLGPAVAMAAAGPFAGRVTGARAVPVMATSLGAGGVMLLGAAFVSGLPPYLAAVTGGGAALGLGNALTLTATQGVIRPERAGEASGLTKTVLTVAAGLGVVAAGPTADPGGSAAAAGDHGPLAVAGAGCLATCLLLALWGWGGRRGPRARRPGEQVPSAVRGGVR